MARILIIDDDKAFRSVLAETLRDLGHTPIEAPSGQVGLDRLAQESADAVFLDFKMPGADGLEVLRKLRARPETISLPVVMLTAFASSSNTIEAMKLGAFEHLTKPLRRRDIEMLIGRMLAPAAPPARSPEPTQDRLIGMSEGMREVQKLIGRAAASDATVLITGETGTGKELVARTLHDSSARSAGPFVPVNCAAIPRDLLESELFGHVKGAFTGAIANRTGAFQRANGGTLFLDEIGDMGVDMQAKLLRRPHPCATAAGAHRRRAATGRIFLDASCVERTENAVRAGDQAPARSCLARKRAGAAQCDGESCDPGAESGYRGRRFRVLVGRITRCRRSGIRHDAFGRRLERSGRGAGAYDDRAGARRMRGKSCRGSASSRNPPPIALQKAQAIRNRIRWSLYSATTRAHGRGRMRQPLPMAIVKDMPTIPGVTGTR
jgi:CheY-like chemotaxis protein